jgi:hypothetical protein
MVWNGFEKGSAGVNDAGRKALKAQRRDAGNYKPRISKSSNTRSRRG